MNRIKLLLEKFRMDHAHSAYRINLSSLDLSKFYIGPAVLRPDKSWVALRLAYFLYTHPTLYKGKTVLDIGSGSGIQGIVCAKKGARNVVLSDISDQAIACSEQNVIDQGLESKVKIIRSDLFDNLTGRFEVIIFNHPFFPNEPQNEVERIVYSGKGLLERFFREVGAHSNQDSLLIMPYSHFAGLNSANNPSSFFRKLGWSYEDYVFSNKFGSHSIYAAKIKE